MFWVLASLITFFGIWVGVAAYGKSKKWSGTLCVGGGFVSACCAVSIAFALVFEYRKLTAPASLEVAGIAGKQWDREQLNLAAQITVKNLRAIHAFLQDGDKRGDAATGVQAIDVLNPLMAAWNDQRGSDADAYRNCRLAAAHLAGGAIAVAQGGRLGSSAQFQAALSACDRSIR